MNNWYREYVLQCLVCDRSYRPHEVSYYCPHCKIDGALDTLYDYASLKREWSRDSLAHHQARGMWRYDRLMPLRSVAYPGLSTFLAVRSMKSSAWPRE